MSEDREPPLSDQERKALRLMLERDRRAAWAWSQIRMYSTIIVAVVAAVTVAWDFLKRIAKAAIE